MVNFYKFLNILESSDYSIKGFHDLAKKAGLELSSSWDGNVRTWKVSEDGKQIIKTSDSEEVYKLLKKHIKNEVSSDGWPEEEAYGEAEHVLEMIKEAGDDIEEIDYVKKHIASLYNHWNKVFSDDPNDLPSFIAKFNSMMPSKDFYIFPPENQSL